MTLRPARSEKGETMLKGMLVNSYIGQLGFGLRETVDLHQAIHGQLEDLGCISNDVMARQLLERLCEDGKIFIDVGCHIGSVVAGVSRQSNPSKIIAVEAIGDKVVALRKRFPDLELHECAVSDQEGEVEFTIDLDRPGYSSLDPALKERSAATKLIRVKMTTMDNIMPHEGIDLIKIDVEGAELGVLRGAEALTKASRPVYMFESGPVEMEGYPLTALWQWFDDHDYDVLTPNRLAHYGAGMSLEIFLDSHVYPRRTDNYFGVPRERRESLRTRTRQVMGFSPD